MAPERQLSRLSLPPRTTQVVLSTTSGWDDTAATVQCFERAADGWRAAGTPIASRVGRGGLGWGIGHHLDGEGPEKREGDGRAPAGVFGLGPAFGYAAQPPAGVGLPYRAATARDYFVDAVDSPDYNLWRRIPAGEPDDPDRRWSSFERMRRDDGQYELGVVVHHNSERRIAGRGSAIFVHVWSAPQNATSGCTAMAKTDLLRVLAWLRPDANPLLIQVPRSELSRLRLREPATGTQKQ